MRRWLTWLPLCALSATACASAEHVDVAITRSSPQYVALGIGDSADIAINLTNSEPVSVLVPVEIRPRIYFTEFAYQVETKGQSACNDLVPESYFPGQYLFYAGPIASGASIHCTFRVHRLATSIDSTPLSFNVYEFPVQGPNPRNDGAVFFLGTFTDVAMRSKQIDFSIDAAGRAHSILRLTASNHGPAAVGVFRVSGCTDVFPLPFEVDGEFSGGCGTNEGALCFDPGGSVGYAFPALAPGASASCDLKLTSVEPYSTRLEFPLARIEQDMPDPATGGTLIDTDPSNDEADLFQMAVAPPPAEAAPALGTLTRLVLFFAMIALAVRRIVH